MHKMWHMPMWRHMAKAIVAMAAFLTTPDEFAEVIYTG
jgi:hypothetical protein